MSNALPHFVLPWTTLWLVAIPPLKRDDIKWVRIRHFRVRALLWREGCEDLADLGTNGVDGAGSGVAQQVLELCKGLLDRL
jgi:hypothetical protein